MVGAVVAMLLTLSSPWAERLAARAGRPHNGPTPPPPLPDAAPASTAEIVQELHRFVVSTVEPAIAAVQQNELASGSTETCFATAGGKHLRARCCVYFSTLAAALLQHRYGAVGAAEKPEEDLSTRVLYGLMARWFLSPPSRASEDDWCARRPPPGSASL